VKEVTTGLDHDIVQVSVKGVVRYGLRNKFESEFNETDLSPTPRTYVSTQ
jgi:hypothetical protein